MLDRRPKIYVFCNTCGPGWHHFTALAEDGHFLADHLCSDHGYAPHDMGLVGNWKHDTYNKHFPNGWQIEMVEKPREHAGVDVAYEKHCALAEAPKP